VSLLQESAGAFMIDVVTVGETMVLVRTDAAEKPKNKMTCTLAIGGTESNVAIALARLGHKVRWISSLGEDAFGNMVAEILRGEGVEVVATFDPERQTGLMVKTPSIGTERFVSYYRASSAASAMTADSVSDSLIADARLVHLTGVMPALSDSTRRASMDIAKRSKDLGKTVSFDVNYRKALWSEAKAKLIFRELTNFAEIIFGDRSELELLVENPADADHDLLEQISELGPKQVVMKLADEGAVALIDGEIYTQPAFKVDVLDTVGAGDAFVAGYLSAFLEGEDARERLVRGAFCGAMACTSLGDWEGSPTKATYEARRAELVR
jgi:2-dehydro-3-deoxygluconokinase